MILMSHCDLLAYNPDEILDLLAPLIEDFKRDEIDWEFFADGCSDKARALANSDAALSLQWATAAVFVYDRLSPKMTGSVKQHLECHAMNLRVTLILRIGPKSADPVLDPLSVEDWFFSQSGLSLHDLRSALDRADYLFQSIPFAYLHERFLVLTPLLDAGYCIRCYELQQWKVAIERIICGPTQEE